MPGSRACRWMAWTSAAASACSRRADACIASTRSPCPRRSMSTWDERWLERVRLLVQVLPVFDQEPRFALKGGTAINLFEHDLPRLSVDIDLTWLPTQAFEVDAVQIAQALDALAARLAAPPLRLPTAPWRPID